MTFNPRPLKKLFEDLFTQTSLRRFLDDYAGRYSAEFPHSNQPVADMVADAVAMLKRIGLINENLFVQLVASLPEHRDRIVEVTKMMLGDDAARRAFGGGTVTWLHLSDMHLGQKGHVDLWPDVEDALFRDLRKVHGETGPWDVVLFTGDMTQQGRTDEFEKLNDVLGALWKLFAELGFSPALATVPGNHDAQWRDPGDSTVQELLELHAHPLAYAAFWEDATSRYRRKTAEAFEPYYAWHQNDSFPKLSVTREGWLPGDFSGVIEKGTLRLGIVGLNSTALQLVDGKHVRAPADPEEPFKGRMTLSRAQFHAACGGNGARWRRDEVDLALLMTHHPPDWLHAQDLEIYQESIYPPGRFLVHLFGHMHRHVNRTLAEAGAEARRTWQGNSVCGLKHYSGGLDRRHGYTVGSLKVRGGKGSLRFWPRAAVRMEHGSWVFGQDPASEVLMDGGTVPIEIAVTHR